MDIGKISDTQKANPNSLDMFLRKEDMKQTLEATISIIRLENNHRKVNTL